MSFWHTSYWYEPSDASAINTPTLTWADAENGTGGVATIAGSTAGTTNTVYTAPFTGDTGSVTWTSKGSRTGDGTVSVTLSTGYYLMYVTSVFAGYSNKSVVHYVVASDSATLSLEYRLGAAIQTRLRSLTMTGLATDSIVFREVPTKQNLAMPCVVIAPERAAIVSGGSNQRDDTDYGFYVAMFAADNQALTANAAKYTKWLDQVRRAFRNQRISGVTESVLCRVEPINTIPFSDWSANYFAGGMILRCLCRQTRGLT